MYYLCFTDGFETNLMYGYENWMGNVAFPMFDEFSGLKLTITSTQSCKIGFEHENLLIEKLFETLHIIKE